MTRVKISEDALQDLNDGFVFYEAQEGGLGEYFATCLRADIESLRIYGGIHRVVFRDYHRLLSKVFPYGNFTRWRMAVPLFGRSLTSGVIRIGFGAGWWNSD